MNAKQYREQRDRAVAALGAITRAGACSGVEEFEWKTHKVVSDWLAVEESKSDRKWWSKVVRRARG